MSLNLIFRSLDEEKLESPENNQISIASLPLPTNSLTLPQANEMDPTHSTAAASRPETDSSDLCFEIIEHIQAFLPRATFTAGFDSSKDSNLMSARTCMNWLTVSRRSAFWGVWLKKEEVAGRFLAALRSNEAYVARNPGWPRMNSTISRRKNQNGGR
jgi:hypothetical protein